MSSEQEEIPYIRLTYIPQEHLRPDRITHVYYGTIEDDSFTYLGRIEKTGSYENPKLVAFDANGKQIFLETKDWQKIDRHFQRKGYALELEQKEKKAHLKSIRRKQEKDRDQGIEQ